MSKKKPLVSIIITTKNEEQVIARLLVSIKNQTYKNTEVIVIDNNSDDKTVRISKKFTDKVFTKGPERSVQRNYGVSKSKGEYLLILDADMELSKRVVEECVDKIKQNTEISSIVIPEESIASGFWEKVKAFERSFYNLEGDKYTDAARFFRKSIFIEVGGYDESITGPEDWDLPESIRKKGYKEVRIKSKIYHYERISSPFSIARKKFYYALKANRYIKKHGISTFTPKTVYFLRPVFYRNWRKLIKNPVLTLGMIIMLTLELACGSLGYFVGLWKKS